MPFAVEQIPRIGLARAQPQGIQDDRTVFCRMDPTQIDRQPVVDEEVHVVVAREIEDLAGLVVEGAVHLHAETEIVLPPVVRPIFHVERIRVPVRECREGVDREEIRTAVRVEAVRIHVHGKVDAGGGAMCVSGVGGEPVVGHPRGVAGIAPDIDQMRGQWFPVGSQGVLDVPGSRAPSVVLPWIVEAGIGVVEITDDGGQLHGLGQCRCGHGHEGKQDRS